MANPWYTRALSFPLGQTARGDNVQSELDGVQVGFDRVNEQIAHRFTNADFPGSSAFTENAANRGNKIPMFDSAGNPALRTATQAGVIPVAAFTSYSAAVVTTASVTGVVGTFHALNISGLTADRNFILPDGATVDDRVGLWLSLDAPASFELNIVTAASGSRINNVNAGGGTPWSSVFIAGEVLIFRCINAGGAGDTDWVVEYDGRIPCQALLRLSADQTSVADETFTKIVLDAEDIDIGNIADPTTNNRINTRRAGNYQISGAFTVALAAADKVGLGTIYKGGARALDIGRGSTGTGSTGVTVSGSVLFPMDAPNFLELYVWQTSGGSRTVSGGNSASPAAARLSVLEVL